MTFVYGELLIGDKGERTQLLADYEQMHQAPAVPHVDVVEFVREPSVARPRGRLDRCASPGVSVGRAAEVVDN